MLRFVGGPLVSIFTVADFPIVVLTTHTVADSSRHVLAVYWSLSGDHAPE